MWEKYFQEFLYSLERDLVFHSYQRATGQCLFSLSCCGFTHSWKCLCYHGWSIAFVFTVALFLRRNLTERFPLGVVSSPTTS